MAEQRPADNLRARAAVTDRAARFEHRLAAVEAQSVRRRSQRRTVRVLLLVAVACVGALAPVIVAAASGGDDPSLGLIVSAAAGAVAVALLAALVLARVAARRGSEAWDWYHERYVLLGNPSRDVQDADRPGRPTRGPLEL